MIKLSELALKVSIEYTMQKSGQMVLKGAKWLHNDEIMPNGPERSQFGTK